MPFKSEAQRRYLFARHPDVAKRWAAEFPGQKGLPYHVRDAVIRRRAKRHRNKGA